MKAVYINPALLAQRDDETLYEAIKFHRSWVEKVCEQAEPDKPVGITLIEKAVASFSIGLEIYEFQCERCGYDVIPPLPPEDWYDHGNVLPPLHPGWTARQVTRLIHRYNLQDPEPDPEDTALD